MKNISSSITCVIIDPDNLFQEVLISYIDQIPYLNLVAVFNSPLIADQFLENNNIELLFVCTDFDQINGVEWVKSLKDSIQVVFLSDYKEKAVDTYELDALDYLLKPTLFERFYKTAIKAKVKIKANQIQESLTVEKCIFVRSENRINKILISDIQFIESQNNYINIVTEERQYITLMKLKDIHLRLPNDLFIRIQKSFIININYVKAIEGNSVVINDNLFTISRNLKKEVINSFTQGQLI
ncbi:LytR/AlgR family response regulator transcription factor [Flammeovirga kamogawensis]|uniref:LytTR family DNA-binding domain-containing protein n=1 Tax=Flammeovirga kamogawensis TaxID=373891 RepID=A0ABX8GWI0_9BACT|nr:LytTR family DNA-binding domain-containing protein [Flammeovirga kamogawensis]MBB6461195.1 DNA-binding LytR/AlgR family response regulator [Flammeovirga kamogawensis]QWG07758.1 LytTR family DNA-binding domain-containing protein [Flammeovirga kamogawensis]TRX69564.1 response regulator transcription factor [Flammeovirga kamogawensis]